MSKVKELIEEYLLDTDEEILIFENPSYESAFIGISDDNRAVYDYDLMVIDLMENDDMDELEAIEFIDYNTLRTLPYYTKAPIILHRLY